MAKKSKVPAIQQYITKTQKEINDRAINNLKSIYKESELIAIDDSILPVLVVLSSDILSGNHDAAINSAATLKVANLTISSIQEGEIQPPDILDINTIIPMFQNIISALPLINQCGGSVIECIGKNISQQSEPEIFQFGLAMHMGANVANPTKSSQLQEIGICVGNIYFNKNKTENYTKIKELIKSLPKNKFRNRLNEYIEMIYKETNEQQNESSRKESDNTTNNDVSNTQEDLEKAIGDIKEPISETDIKFSTKDTE